MRAVIYTRVSSDPKDERRSVTEQEHDCRKVCERNGWDVQEVFCDNDRGASRHSRKARPQYVALRDYLTHGEVDVLVLWEGSRAQRDLNDFVKLRDLCAERGILYSYSGKTYDLSRTDDRFSTALDALLAEREADVTRDRVLRAVRANATAGRPHGKLSYGYAREYDERGNFVRQYIVEDQAAVIREAARRVAAGQACRAIAVDFNRRDIPAPGGGRWVPTQVRRVAMNPAYVGQRVHRGAVVGDAVWPAILDEDVYAQCRARLADPRRKTLRDATLKHLLSGSARCGICESRMRVLKNRGYLTYVCHERFCVAIRTTKIEAFVNDLVVARLSRPDVMRMLAAADDGDQAARAEEQVRDLRSRLDQFYAAAAAGEISPAGLARVESRLLAEIDEVEQRSFTARVPQVLREVAGPDLDQRWPTLPIAVRREVIDLLMEIRVFRTVRGERKFRPERVQVTWRLG